MLKLIIVNLFKLIKFLFRLVFWWDKKPRRQSFTPTTVGGPAAITDEEIEAVANTIGDFSSEFLKKEEAVFEDQRISTERQERSWDTSVKDLTKKGKGAPAGGVEQRQYARRVTSLNTQIKLAEKDLTNIQGRLNFVILLLRFQEELRELNAPLLKAINSHRPEVALSFLRQQGADINVRNVNINEFGEQLHSYADSVYTPTTNTEDQKLMDEWNKR
jgi:hypothetical protein